MEKLYLICISDAENPKILQKSEYLEFRHKFVSLQIKMKGIITKITAVLLVVWYLMSIIGFGVHTCSGSGKSFVVSFVEGLSCEDIHPEHHCSKESCCHHSHSCCNEDSSLCLKSKSCCSNDYQVLALTGTVSDEKNGAYESFSFAYCHCIRSEIFGQEMFSRKPVSAYPVSDSSPGHMPDMQSVLSVWRI